LHLVGLLYIILYSCSYSGILSRTETFNASPRKLEVANRNSQVSNSEVRCGLESRFFFSELTVPRCSPKPRFYPFRLDLIPAFSEQRISWRRQNPARWIVGCFTPLSYCVPLTLQQNIRKLHANIRGIHTNDHTVIFLVMTPSSLQKNLSTSRNNTLTSIFRLPDYTVSPTQTTIIIIFHVPHLTRPNQRCCGLSATCNQ